jgi:hypothetical protein
MTCSARLVRFSEDNHRAERWQVHAPVREAAES